MYMYNPPSEEIFLTISVKKKKISSIHKQSFLYHLIV